MNNSRKRIFITGIAGFIGMHLAEKLIERGDSVTGCDNFNNYYDPQLKKARAERLPSIFHCNICDEDAIEKLITDANIDHVIHLAGQAGVRHSTQFPSEYHTANSVGFFHILEVLRRNPHIKLTFASSSSVYGLNKKIPFSEEDKTDSPSNFYGATKKCNELMAFSYHNLYNIPMVGLRFFTVYGPWGRPDMAYTLFTKAILEGRPIHLFNHGEMKRDFTYIDDIVTGTIAAMDGEHPFEIFNLGSSEPEELLKMVEIIEQLTGKKAIKELLPIPRGEIPTTYADISKAQKLLNFHPKVSLEEGIERYISWAKGAFAVK